MGQFQIKAEGYQNMLFKYKMLEKHDYEVKLHAPISLHGSEIFISDYTGVKTR